MAIWCGSKTFGLQTRLYYHLLSFSSWIREVVGTGTGPDTDKKHASGVAMNVLQGQYHCTLHSDRLSIFRFEGSGYTGSLHNIHRDASLSYQLQRVGNPNHITEGVRGPNPLFGQGQSAVALLELPCRLCGVKTLTVAAVVFFRSLYPLCAKISKSMCTVGRNPCLK